MAAPTVSGSFTEIFNTLAVPTNYAGNTFASNAAVLVVASATDVTRLFWTVRNAQITLSVPGTASVGQTYSRRIAFLAPFNGAGKSIIVPYAGMVSNGLQPLSLLAPYTDGATGVFLTLFSGTVGTFTDYKTFAIGRSSQLFYPSTLWDCAFIQPDAAGIPAYSGGTFDSTNIWGFELTFGYVSSAINRKFALFEMFLINSTPKVLGGDITTPVTTQNFSGIWGDASVLPLQSARLMMIHSVESTAYLFHPAVVGEVADPAYWAESDFDINFWRKPLSTKNMRCHALDGFNGLDIYFAIGSSLTRGRVSGSQGDRFSKFNVSGAGTVPIVDCSFSALKPVTLYSGWNQTGGQWSNCGEIVANGAALTNALIFGSTDSSALSINTSAVISNATIRACSTGLKLLASGTYSNLSATITNSAIADVVIPTGVAGAINIVGVTFPTSGSTSPVNIRYEGTGTVTITVNRSGLTTTTPNGGTVVLIPPVIVVTAPNFQQDTRVQVARINSYTVASTAINTATDVITIASHRFRSTGVPSLVAFQLAPSATLPTSSPAIRSPNLYYCVNVSGSTFQLSETAGGAPLDFSTQGTGNFIFTGYTELDNSLAGVSGYSFALTETNGALLQVKARPWQNLSGCTAGIFYQANFTWNSTTGIVIADTLSIAATPDTIHNTAIGKALTLADGSTSTVTSDGSTVTGLSGVADGTVSINRSSGLLLIQDSYAWFVWFSSTQAGIRLVNPTNFKPDDLFNYQLTSITLKNINATSLQWLGGYARSSTGSNLINSASNAMFLNSGEKGIAIATSSGGGSGLDAAGVRAAIGLATANLDTQIASLPSVAQLNARTIISANYALEATSQIIKTKTDGLNFTGANVQAIAIAVSDKSGYTLSQAFPTNFSSLAIAVGGATTVGTNSDKTGYALSQTFPANFSALGINVSGHVSRVTLADAVSDKAGFSLASTQSFNLTGSVSGSVGSVTGAVVLPTIPASWITAAGIGSAAFTAAKFAVDAIDSNAIAASAIAEIQAGLATSSDVATNSTQLALLTKPRIEADD